MDKKEAHADQTFRFSNLSWMGNTEATILSKELTKTWAMQKALTIPFFIFFCLSQLII